MPGKMGNYNVAQFRVVISALLCSIYKIVALNCISDG